MRTITLSLLLSATSVLLSQDILVGNGLKLSGHKAAICTLEPVPNEKNLVLCGDWDGELRLWDMDKKKSIADKTLRSGFIRGLHVSKRGGMFIACTNRTIVIGKIKPFGFKHEIPIINPYPIYCSDVTISPDGSTVAALVSGEGVHFYATNNGKLLGTVALRSESSSICYLADGRVATAGFATELGIINGMQLDPPLPIGKSISRIDQLVLSPDGSHIAAAGQNQVKIIPLLSGAAPMDTPVNESGVASIAWAHDGQSLIVSYEEGIVVFYALTGQFIEEKKLLQGQSSAVAMTSGGSWFVSGGGTYSDMNSTPPRKTTGDNSLLAWPLARKTLTANAATENRVEDQPPPEMSEELESQDSAIDPNRWSKPMHSAAQAYQLVLEEAMKEATEKEDFGYAQKLKQERDLVSNGLTLVPSANAPVELRDARNLYIKHEEAFRLSKAKRAQ